MLQKVRPYTLQRWTLGLLVVILISCAAPGETQPSLSPQPPDDPAPAATLTATAPPIPSNTTVPTATAVLTPPALPEIYISEHLNPLDTPHTYIEDTCEYLKNRWNPNNAAPGTVVMVIKLHGITRNEAKSSADVTVREFERMIENVREQGFEAITSEQLANFLESNAKIPPRSVVLLQDGRRTAENFDHRFRPYWKAWNWPIVNAWIIQTNSPKPLIQDNLALEQEGFVDHQLYSPLQRYSDTASEEYLSGEFNKYTDIFEERYDKAPVAIVWPDEPGINFPKAARGQASGWDSPRTRAGRSCTTGSHWQIVKIPHGPLTIPKALSMNPS